jgi:hypothetical protein
MSIHDPGGPRGIWLARRLSWSAHAVGGSMAGVEFQKRMDIDTRRVVRLHSENEHYFPILYARTTAKYLHVTKIGHAQTVS